MCYQWLPPNVLSKGTLRGKEYAWPLADVEETVRAAAGCGLATLGGQVQFRTPDGTYELYWLCADSTDRRLNEPWEAYVTRSASEVLAAFANLRAHTDFLAEAILAPGLKGLSQQGIDLNQYLCFVLVFSTVPPIAADS